VRVTNKRLTRWFLTIYGLHHEGEHSLKTDELAISSHTFAQQIEELVWTTNVSYMEAVLLWCDKRGLEPEVGAELVRKSAPLKGKIQCEAEELRFLKPSGAKLPI
jgi:hypothetical protein